MSSAKNTIARLTIAFPVGGKIPVIKLNMKFTFIDRIEMTLTVIFG